MKTFYGTWMMNKYIGGGIKSFLGIIVLKEKFLVTMKEQLAICILIIII